MTPEGHKYYECIVKKVELARKIKDNRIALAMSPDEADAIRAEKVAVDLFVRSLLEHWPE